MLLCRDRNAPRMESNLRITFLSSACDVPPAVEFGNIQKKQEHFLVFSFFVTVAGLQPFFGHYVL